MSKRKKFNNVIRGRILIKNRSDFNIFVEAIKPKDCETIRTSYLGLISTQTGTTPPITIRSKALVLSFAGDPHSLSCVSHRSPLTTFSNTEFSIFINRRLLQNIQPFTGSHGGLRCDGCGKSGCEKGFGDSLLSCNSLAHITRFIHDPIKEVIASIGRASGVRVAVEPASVSRQDRRRTDLKFSGLLADGGQLYADVTVTWGSTL